MGRPALPQAPSKRLLVRQGLYVSPRGGSRFPFLCIFFQYVGRDEMRHYCCPTQSYCHMLATTPSLNTQAWSYCKELSPTGRTGLAGCRVPQKTLFGDNRNSTMGVRPAIETRIRGVTFLRFIAIMVWFHDVALGAPLLLPSLLDKCPRQGDIQEFTAARRVTI